MVLECQKIVMFNWTLISDVIFWLANISNLDADHRKKNDARLTICKNLFGYVNCCLNGEEPYSNMLHLLHELIEAHLHQVHINYISVHITAE